MIKEDDFIVLGRNGALTVRHSIWFDFLLEGRQLGVVYLVYHLVKTSSTKQGGIMVNDQLMIKGLLNVELEHVRNIAAVIEGL